MRSFMMQIIAVIGMVFALMLAIRFWGAEAPRIPALPSFQTLLPQRTSDAFLGGSCPGRNEAETTASPQPQWTVPPAPAVQDYPQSALDAGISGDARVTCDAMPDGRVKNCRVTTETPAGYGFGESAIRIVQRGCLTRFSEEHSPVEFTVRVPFNLD